ncbi:MAG: hypothetical protein ACI8W7_001243 [Gammaproteobacteria bacterium]|jgi:hypothetical protein
MTDAPHEPRSDAAKLMNVQRTSLFIDVLLICGCAYILVGDVVQALSDKPEFALRGWAFLLNLTAAFALLQRSLVLLRRFSRAAAPAATQGVNKWSVAFTVVLPLLVASGIELVVHGGHRAQLSTLVATISALTANALTNNPQVRAADLLTLRGPYLQELKVRMDSGAFLLKARVPAFDSDGLAARYSSTERVWYLDPYTSETQTSPRFDARGPTLVCALVEQRLSCERDDK